MDYEEIVARSPVRARIVPVVGADTSLLADGERGAYEKV
jgi:hypothetical protein